MKAKNERRVVLRDHVYDGIQEYDQKLPNWWLYTLYGAIIFSFVYWYALFQSNVAAPMTAIVRQEVAGIYSANAANAKEVTPDGLWAMAGDSTMVAAGRDHFAQNCAACHGADMKGIPGNGANLLDAEWLNGRTPLEIYKIVENGLPEKGMVAWGPQRGQRFVFEATAFVLSFHQSAPDGGLRPR